MQSLLQMAFINMQCKMESFLTGIISCKNAFLVMSVCGFCMYIFSNIIGTHTAGLLANSLYLLRSLIAVFALILSPLQWLCSQSSHHGMLAHTVKDRACHPVSALLSRCTSKHRFLSSLHKEFTTQI